MEEWWSKQSSWQVSILVVLGCSFPTCAWWQKGGFASLSQRDTVVSEGFGEMVSNFLIGPQGKSECVQILSFNLVNKSRMLTKGRTIAGISSERIWTTSTGGPLNWCCSSVWWSLPQLGSTAPRFPQQHRHGFQVTIAPLQSFWCVIDCGRTNPLRLVFQREKL